MSNIDFISIIDAHCHIQFPAYDNDYELVIDRARKKRIKMIAVGTQASTSKKALDLAHKYPADIWATVGFHPLHLNSEWYHDKNEQEENNPPSFDFNILYDLGKDLKVVAIGECGLDYFRLVQGDKKKVFEVKEKQREIFIKQIELAQKLKKPLMVHCRPGQNKDDAYRDAIELLGSNKNLKVIMHFFAGNLEIAKIMTEKGFYFTFGGVITFNKNYDEIIKYVPSDRIMVESDCPYVAPKSRRGKRNEPSFISETIQRLAEIKGITFDEMIKILFDNAKYVFGIDTFDSFG